MATTANPTADKPASSGKFKRIALIAVIALGAAAAAAGGMDVFLSKLRKYLREDHRVEILNVHGKGYKLLVN